MPSTTIPRPTPGVALRFSFPSLAFRLGALRRPRGNRGVVLRGDVFVHHRERPLELPGVVLGSGAAGRALLDRAALNAPHALPH